MSALLSRIRLFGAIVLVVSGCGSAEGDAIDVDVANDQTHFPSWENYRSSAQANATKQADGSLLFNVEWDLWLTEEGLRANYEENVARDVDKLAVFQQVSTGFEPTFPAIDAVDISYCVSTSFANQSTVVSDMATATSKWQSVANVRFRYDSSQNGSCDQNNTNVDFAVIPTTQPGYQGCAANKLLWAAVGGCPSGGGGTIIGVLEMQYGIIPAASGEFNGTTPVGVMSHELGHILGFRHEHPWTPGGCASEAIAPMGLDTTGRRLTAYDNTSVMHYPVSACGGTPNVDFGFSELDGVGARSIYGMPAAWYVSVRSLI
jgi:hypothetical protein